MTELGWSTFDETSAEICAAAVTTHFAAESCDIDLLETLREFLDSIGGGESVHTSSLVEGSMCLDVFDDENDEYFTDYKLCPAGQGCHFDDGNCTALAVEGTSCNSIDYAPGLYCEYTDDAGSICRSTVPANGDCVNDDMCATKYCDVSSDMSAEGVCKDSGSPLACYYNTNRRRGQFAPLPVSPLQTLTEPNLKQICLSSESDGLFQRKNGFDFDETTKTMTPL